MFGSGSIIFLKVNSSFSWLCLILGSLGVNFLYSTCGFSYVSPISVKGVLQLNPWAEQLLFNVILIFNGYCRAVKLGRFQWERFPELMREILNIYSEHIAISFFIRGRFFREKQSNSKESFPLIVANLRLR